MKKIKVIIVSKDHPSKECMESVINQDYSDFTILTHYKSPVEIHYDPQINKSKNIALHRNEVKTLALASDAEYFLLVDSDMVIPPNTISNLVIQTSPKKIVGGWCQVVDKTNRWVAGKWVADNTIFQYQFPQPHVIEVDFLSLACVMLSREALSELDFEDGFDKECLNASLNSKMKLGTCVAFGNKAIEKGYSLFVDGSVICKHLKGLPSEPPKIPQPISICTVVWNGLDFTKKFIDSLKSNTKFPYELVVVDNGSDMEVSEYLKTQTNNYFRFDKNVGFSKAFNKAISMASFDDVLITNNDTIYPQNNWVRVLREEFLKSSNCGLLFPCVNNILSRTNLRSSEGKNTLRTEKRKQICSGVSIFTKKEIVNKLGGFDEIFFVSGEDADLQFKAWESGYDIYVTEKVFIEHIGKATAKFLPDWQGEWKKSNEIFSEKWKETLCINVKDKSL